MAAQRSWFIMLSSRSALFPNTNHENTKTRKREEEVTRRGQRQRLNGLGPRGPCVLLLSSLLFRVFVSSCFRDWYLNLEARRLRRGNDLRPVIGPQGLEHRVVGPVERGVG